jgi:hypothetical protein
LILAVRSASSLKSASTCATTRPPSASVPTARAISRTLAAMPAAECWSGIST